MSRTNNNKLRIGIVGAGAIVRDRHLPGLKKHPEVEIVAVSNSTYESAEKFCQENAPHATPMANWADLLAVSDLDIVWIGTPPYMHSAVTVPRSKPANTSSASPYVQRSRRSKRDAGGFQNFLSWSMLVRRLWFEGRPVKIAGRKLSRPSAPYPAPMFHRGLSERRRACPLGQRIEIAG